MSVFIAAFLLVAIKSFQQLNVVNYKYAWVVPTSFAFAAGEIFIVLQIVTGSWDIWPYLGAVVAMWVHRKVIKTSSSSEG